MTPAAIYTKLHGAISRAYRETGDARLVSWFQSNRTVTILAIRAGLSMQNTPEARAIRELIEAKRAELSGYYEAWARRLWALALEKFGPTLHGYRRDTAYEALTHVVDSGDTYRGTLPSLNEKRLAKTLREWTAEALQDLFEKLLAKVGYLDTPAAEGLDGFAFRLTGTRRGHKVRIEQRMIVNVSSKGRPFNQFPALIYVDGKKTGEAAYKRMFS